MADYLYIHIPFCVRKCIYCDFLSFRHDEDLANAYVTALCKELIMKKGYAGVLKSVYIGGGTPTSLSQKQLNVLLVTIRNNYHYSSDIEITVEANPGTVDAEKAGLLASLGVNRISLGVQSFIDDELKTLGRIHDSREAVSSAGIITASGISNLSIDLIYGIPGQSEETWKQTLSTALSLSPKHISAYELTPEKNTRLRELMVKGELSMPDDERILCMHNFAIGFLERAGFEHYEISNFALPGFRCRHNLNYWDRGEYIGAGAGAHSFVNGRRSRNAGDLKEYAAMTESGVLPETEHADVTLQEAMREYLFLGLRKTDGISLTKARSLGLDLRNSCGELINEGFFEVAGDSFRMTRKGLALSNSVLVRMFELLGL